MEDTKKELERIQAQLLKDEEDAELDRLLSEDTLEDAPTGPAFDDPEQIHDPEQPLVYNNFANDYGAPKRDERKKQRDDKVILGLLVTACVLCLGIIGVLAYWLGVLL